LISFIEKYGFGVCERLSKKFGIRVALIRFLFFYLSIFTLLLGFILYLKFAILFKAKDLIIHKKKTAFDI
tara:strand:- start:927 stop:1136 length:210 start_codon:yes stop_codon:yes gene_type:complete